MAKTAQDCHCGCGSQTKGGRFLPGHDARLKSQLFSAVRDGSAAERRKAEKKLAEFNWPVPKAS